MHYRTSQWIIIWTLAIAFLLGALCLSAQAAATEEKPPNVVWIMLDALRAQNVSCYGYERETTPFLTEYAARGALFETMHSAALWTPPSMASIMTGRYFGRYCITVRPGVLYDYVIPSDGEVLAPTIFEKNGYKTAMVSSHAGFLQGHSLLGRSFEDLIVVQPDYRPNTSTGEAYANLEVVRERAFAWLQDNSEKPFFLYVHAMDTHFPHNLPEGDYTRWIDPDYDASTFFHGGQPKTRPGQIADFDDAAREHMRGLYDGTIAYCDNQLRIFVNQLMTLGLAENTIVVISSDHGEYLAENGQTWGHGGFTDADGIVYGTDEFSRIPCIMVGPGIAPGTRVAGMTQSIDVLPTLVEMLSLESDAGFDGKDLTRHIRNSEHVAGFAVTRAKNIDVEPPVLFVRSDSHVYQYATAEGKDWLWEQPFTMGSRVAASGKKADAVRAQMRQWTLSNVVQPWQDWRKISRMATYVVAYTAQQVKPEESITVPEPGEAAPEDTWLFSYSNLKKLKPRGDLPAVKIYLGAREGQFYVRAEMLPVPNCPMAAIRLKVNDGEWQTFRGEAQDGEQDTPSVILDLGVHRLKTSFIIHVDDVPDMCARLGGLRLDPVLPPSLKVQVAPQNKKMELPVVTDEETQRHEETLEALGYL